MSSQAKCNEDLLLQPNVGILELPALPPLGWVLLLQQSDGWVVSGGRNPDPFAGPLHAVVSLRSYTESVDVQLVGKDA